MERQPQNPEFRNNPENFHPYMKLVITQTNLTLSLPVMTFVICSSCLLMFLSSLYCKQYGPRSDCSLSLIRVHMFASMKNIV